MIVRYKDWPGTGLRLEDPKDKFHCLDMGGGHGSTAKCDLYVGEAQGKGATIQLEPVDVARLAVMCTQWLAWHHSGRGTRV